MKWEAHAPELDALAFALAFALMEAARGALAVPSFRCCEPPPPPAAFLLSLELVRCASACDACAADAVADGETQVEGDGDGDGGTTRVTTAGASRPAAAAASTSSLRIETAAEFWCDGICSGVHESDEGEIACGDGEHGPGLRLSSAVAPGATAPAPAGDLLLFVLCAMLTQWLSGPVLAIDGGADTGRSGLFLAGGPSKLAVAVGVGEDLVLLAS